MTFTFNCTFLELDDERRRAHFSADGRCFSLPVTKTQCKELDGRNGRDFTVMFDEAAGSAEVAS